MIKILHSKIALDHYPHAKLATFYVEAFLAFTRVILKIGPEKIAFLTSICSDDLNSVGIPKTGMIGPFVEGGLDGYPCGQKTRTTRRVLESCRLGTFRVDDLGRRRVVEH